MTRDEWIDVVSWMQTNWAHARFEPAVVAKQWELLGDTTYDAALVAVKALGDRDFPPTPIAIAKKAGELASPDLPGWDEVRPALMLMLRDGYDANHAPSRDGWESHGFHPVLAAFFTPVKWRLWCLTDEADTTFNAQQRDEYRAVCGRSERELALLSAGVVRSGVERGPRRLDPLASIPRPELEITNREGP